MRRGRKLRSKKIRACSPASRPAATAWRHVRQGQVHRALLALLAGWSEAEDGNSPGKWQRPRRDRPLPTRRVRSSRWAQALNLGASGLRAWGSIRRAARASELQAGLSAAPLRDQKDRLRARRPSWPRRHIANGDTQARTIMPRPRTRRDRFQFRDRPRDSRQLKSLRDLAREIAA